VSDPDPRWSEVDAFLESSLLPPDPVLSACLASSSDAGLPDIQVSPSQGMLLHLIARSHRARRILEVGTLGGYSGIQLARALPVGGRLITLELDPKHASVARANFARAGLDDRIEIREGPALRSLDALVAERPEPFDLFFIDADKPSTLAYFERCLRLARPGSVIVVDNVVRHGELANAQTTDPNVRGMREFVSALGRERRVRATGMQTVGSKGYDGFVLAEVVDAPSAP